MGIYTVFIGILLVNHRNTTGKFVFFHGMRMRSTLWLSNMPIESGLLLFSFPLIMVISDSYVSVPEGRPQESHFT